MRTVAALFVEPGGVYFAAPAVDAWPEARDARTYSGPHPVVAHPPCERWGRYWRGRPGHAQFTKGDDGGKFASAIAAVRRWGGVLEHPEASGAWLQFGLAVPPPSGGWIKADWTSGQDGWTCYVEQGAYGHSARKKTWLYAAHVELPSLRWGRLQGEFRSVENMPSSGYQRIATPPLFRDLLLSMARSSCARSEAAA